MATIDGRYIHVENESPSYGVDVTSQPVEGGISLTDHVQPKSNTLELSGSIVGVEASAIRDYLVNAMKSGKKVSFVGRNTFSGLISALSCQHDYKIANGFTFSMSLQEIRLATSSFVKSLPAVVKSQTAKVVSAGTKQKKKKKGKGKKKEEQVAKVKFKKGSPWA